MLLAGAPIAASVLAAACDRQDAVCVPQTPHPSDNHEEHVATALSTETSVAVSSGAASGSPDPDPPWTPDSDYGVAYPESLGQVMPRYLTTGTQEGPGLW